MDVHLTLTPEALARALTVLDRGLSRVGAEEAREAREVLQQLAAPPEDRSTRMVLRRLRATLVVWNATPNELSWFDGWAQQLLRTTCVPPKNVEEPPAQVYQSLDEALHASLDVTTRLLNRTIGFSPDERAAAWHLAQSGNELAFAMLLRRSQKAAAVHPSAPAPAAPAAAPTSAKPTTPTKPPSRTTGGPQR